MTYHPFWLDVVKCQHCAATITVMDCAVTPRYTCKKHYATPQQTEFLQFEQFKYELRRGYNKAPLGMQFCTPYAEDISIPEWAKSDEAIQHILLQSFPKLDSCPIQRYRAARYATVAHLFYRVRYSESDIADELSVTVKEINDVILHLTRLSQGLRANGTGKLKQAPRGRPKGRKNKTKKNSCGDRNLFIED